MNTTVAASPRSARQRTRGEIVAEVAQSACFITETAWLARGGFPIRPTPRLFKFLENDLVRLIFPTTVAEVDEGTAVGLVCLYDLKQSQTIYAHAIFAGPSSNASLRSIFNPPTQAKPQPGEAGNRAIVKFVAWKQAAWNRFLCEELDLGAAAASQAWLGAFWKALDRMYGGGNLTD